jgi:uncharacterized protein
MEILWLLLTGVAAGILSGMFGIGGGVVIVPMLIFLLGVSQQTASGTSLVALLLPVGILGVIEYYKSGKITTDHIQYGLLIAVGLFAGVYVGTKISLSLSEDTLRKAFAVLLVFIAVRLWLK